MMQVDLLLKDPEAISVAPILHYFEQDVAGAVSFLSTILRSKYYGDFSASLQGDEALRFIEILDHALQSVDVDPDIFYEFRRLCGRTGLLPLSHTLIGGLVKDGIHPIASGGFGDVWKGLYNNQRVAVKVLKAYNTNTEGEVKKKFCKEVVVWKRLSHPNVVRFMGISTSLFSFCMVSEWMSQGNIRQYLRSNPAAPRTDLLIDICEGLSYLHSSKVMHGDLKGDNILVNDEGLACLCDFGLTSIAHTYGASTSETSPRGSMRWMAPELFDLDVDVARPSEASDIFSFGMVAIEVFTGRLPFHNLRQEVQVNWKVLSRFRPERPENGLDLGLSDPIWELINKCWDHEKSKRPPATEVLECLHSVQSDANFQSLIQTFDPTSKDSMRTLHRALISETRTIARVNASNEQTFIEILDQAMNSAHASAEMSRSCLRVLGIISHQTGSLPSSYVLADQLEKLQDAPFTSTGFSDVWKGINGDRPVAIKTLRSKVDEKVKKKIFKEVVTWKRLSHKNIINFIGVSTKFSDLCMISEWMPQGNVRDYVLSHPEASRLQLLIEATTGLTYLHTSNILHADLKGDNVVINNAGQACLCDIGLAPIVTKPGQSRSIRWMAPELFGIHSVITEPSRKSDIYALGMVIIEVFTGQVPFAEYRHDAEVISIMTQGRRPAKPVQSSVFGLSDALWDVVEMCWHQDRTKRPALSSVLTCLQATQDQHLLHWMGNFNLDSKESIQSLRFALSSQSHMFDDLRDKNMRTFIDILDKTADSPHTDPELSRKCLHMLRKTCGTVGLCPSSHILELAKTGELSESSRSSDIWKGSLGDKAVAIKSFKLDNKDDLEKVKAHLCRGAVIWKRMAHDNIVRFMGVSTNLLPWCIVSEWMPGGNVRRFVQSRRDTDRLKLLIDICQGLVYLHSNEIVHGNLKGDNVVVNQNGTACICDLGFASISGTHIDLPAALFNRGSVRWMAPELFVHLDAPSGNPQPSKASDIFAFAMVFIEVFTGLVPFHDYHNDLHVIVKLMGGARPKRPEKSLKLGLSDPIWELVESCWNLKRFHRPSATVVLESLNREDPRTSLLPLIHGFDQNSKESIGRLRYALSSREDALLQLRGEDAQNVIDVLDQAERSTHTDEELRRECVRLLRHICGLTGYLPSPDVIKDGLSKTGKLPSVPGSFVDTWQGTYDNNKVRVKLFRKHLVTDPTTLRRVKVRFCSEAIIWRRLKHKNVLPFLGVPSSDPLSSVVPWLPNGNIIEYLGSTSNVRRLPFMVDVAAGLKYIHSRDIVHGNLKGANIIIDDSRRACLTDYGLESIANETLNDSHCNFGNYLSVPWMAPELFDPENVGKESGMPTKASDVYSLAMVFIEVFTGRAPFYGYRDERVIARVMEGVRPERPEQASHIGLTNDVWKLVQMCWQQNRDERPTAAYTRKTLSALAKTDDKPKTIDIWNNAPHNTSDASTTIQVSDKLAKEADKPSKSDPLPKSSSIPSDKSSSSSGPHVHALVQSMPGQLNPPALPPNKPLHSSEPNVPALIQFVSDQAKLNLSPSSKPSTYPSESNVVASMQSISPGVEKSGADAGKPHHLSEPNVSSTPIKSHPGDHGLQKPQPNSSDKPPHLFQPAAPMLPRSISEDPSQMRSSTNLQTKPLHSSEPIIPLAVRSLSDDPRQMRSNPDSFNKQPHNNQLYPSEPNVPIIVLSENSGQTNYSANPPSKGPHTSGPDFPTAFIRSTFPDQTNSSPDTSKTQTDSSGTTIHRTLQLSQEKSTSSNIFKKSGRPSDPDDVSTFLRSVPEDAVKMTSSNYPTLVHPAITEDLGQPLYTSSPGPNAPTGARSVSGGHAGQAKSGSNPTNKQSGLKLVQSIFSHSSSKTNNNERG